MYPYHLVQREIGVKNEAAKSLSQRIVNFYLNNYLQSLFAGAFNNHDFTPLKPKIKIASSNDGIIFKIS